MKELHLTEGRNTGFKKILNALERNGSPKPEFETDEARSYFISRFYIHEGFLQESNEQSLSEDLNLIQKNERSLKEVLKEADYKKVVSIAEVIDERGKITPAEAKLICRKSETTTWRYLNILVDTGYVISEGSINSVIYRKK